MYEKNTREFIPNEPLERHNLSLVSHDIPGNAPNKFKKPDSQYSRETSEMYPHTALQRPNSTLRDNYMARYLVDERTGNTRANASQYILKSAQEILGGSSAQYRPESGFQGQQGDSKRLGSQYEDSKNIGATLRHYDKDVVAAAQRGGDNLGNPHEKPYQDKYRELVGRDYWSPSAQQPNQQQQKDTAPFNQQRDTAQFNGQYRQKYQPEYSEGQQNGQEFRQQAPQNIQNQSSTFAGQGMQVPPLSFGANQGQNRGERTPQQQEQSISRPIQQGDSFIGNQQSQRGFNDQKQQCAPPGQNQNQTGQTYGSQQSYAKNTPDYKAPPVVSEYKESFFNLYGNSRRQGNMMSQSAVVNTTTREQSKLFPVQELDFVKYRRHNEIYNSPQTIADDVLTNPRFYVTESRDHKYHIYDLMELERKAQKAGISNPNNPTFVQSATQRA